MGSEVDSRETKPSRRDVFTLGALATLGALTPASAKARGRVKTSEPASDVGNKLINRITFGYTEAERALYNQLGFNGYLEYHLDYQHVRDSLVKSLLTNYQTLPMWAPQLYTQGSTPVQELTDATIIRSIHSTRQLFERMVEFWTDHFNIDINKEPCNYLKTVDDREVIRKHTLGSFPQMLIASAHSPAMLVYLDNQTSNATVPNQNYARELMELHTLGVDGGYTQQDVIEVARCFSGWGYYTSGVNKGNFYFNPTKHDNGQKVVLGVTIPSGGGQQDGETVLQILLNHPSTALFIATKLCQRFWGENPPQYLISDVKQAFISTGGDIKSMLRAIFTVTNMKEAPRKFKRPYHLIVSALRCTSPTITSYSSFRGTYFASVGQVPFQWSPPDGYPDTMAAWVDLILPRWNFGFSMMNGNVSGVSVNVDVLFAGMTNEMQIADKIDSMLFGGEMDPTDKQLLRNYLLPNPPSSTRKKEAIALALASSGFQWH